MKASFYKTILFLSLFPSFISASTLSTFYESIPFMSISYGPGTVLMPGTSIKTNECVIERVELSSNGVFSIGCRIRQ